MVAECPRSSDFFAGFGSRMPKDYEQEVEQARATFTEIARDYANYADGSIKVLFWRPSA